MQESNKVKPDEFQIGDVVWDLVYGKGCVAYISNYSTIYPVEVDFETRGSIWYTKDGKYNTDLNRTLFFSEPKIEASVTRPFVPTLVGKRVVIQYYDGTWIPHPVVVTFETEEEIFSITGSAYKSDLIAIREVSSENLLTSKK